MRESCADRPGFGFLAGVDRCDRRFITFGREAKARGVLRANSARQAASDRPATSPTSWFCSKKALWA